MIIDIYLNKFKEVIQSSKKIGKTFENKSTILRFHLINDIDNVNLYLDIQKPNGTKYRSAALTINNNIADFEVTNSVLDQIGMLEVEAILQNNDGYVLKYPTLEFKVVNSINAEQSIEDEKPDFVSECQKVIDLIKVNGDGSKYLNDKGEYLEVSGGNCNIKYVESSTDNLVYIRDLESGTYILNGSFRPFNGSTMPMNCSNVMAQITKTKATSFMQLFYPLNNRVQYFTITDDNMTYEMIYLSQLATKKYVDDAIASIGS